MWPEKKMMCWQKESRFILIHCQDIVKTLSKALSLGCVYLTGIDTLLSGDACSLLSRDSSQRDGLLVIH